MIPEEKIQQVLVAIEAETHTITWEEAPLAVRLASIRRCIEKHSGAEPAEAGKNPPKQRKTRGPNKQKSKEPKTAPEPLTRHAAGIGQENE